MRGPRGEAVLFGTANPENEADGAGSVRPQGKNALRKSDEKRGVLVNQISNLRSSEALLPSIVLVTKTVRV